MFQLHPKTARYVIKIYQVLREKVSKGVFKLGNICINILASLQSLLFSEFGRLEITNKHTPNFVCFDSFDILSSCFSPS